MNILPAYASTSSSPPPIGTSTEQPKPGTIMIVTFENGTTKAIRSDSTNLQAVNGGYFIADSSVRASQPLQSKTVSKTVVQQLVSVFVDVRIADPPTTSKGCAEGWGYYVDDSSPICEPLDKIGKSPPSDMAFCAALGCPYNPPAESELPGGNNNNNLATTPVTPTETPAVGPQLPSEPEPNPGDWDQNEGEENENENQKEDSDDGDDDGNDASGDGGSDDSEE